MPKAKVLVIVPYPMTEAERANRAAQQQAVRLGPDIEFHYRSTRAAPTGFVGGHDMALVDLAILEVGLSAEEEGFAAVCIDTVSDSGMAALRSVLAIPVIGPGRAAMLYALTLGERFSILAMWQRWRHLYAKTLDEMQLWPKCASIRAIDVAPDSRNLLSGKEDQVFPLLAAEGMKCVADGADVIILGSTTMHQAAPYLQKHLPVPVINPGPLSYKLVEAVLGLGLSHSKKTYPKPLVPKAKVLRAMFDAAAKHPMR
ncbi:MAG: hydrogenase expression protein HupH [Alphaproteobacteria bacterium]|nr:hydrogenase expression protein HupH [Alphaproteobacteria bacterium]